MRRDIRTVSRNVIRGGESDSRVPIASCMNPINFAGTEVNLLSGYGQTLWESISSLSVVHPPSDWASSRSTSSKTGSS